jgi:hypothetical protein
MPEEYPIGDQPRRPWMDTTTAVDRGLHMNNAPRGAVWCNRWLDRHVSAGALTHPNARLLISVPQSSRCNVGEKPQLQAKRRESANRASVPRRNSAGWRAPRCLRRRDPGPRINAGVPTTPLHGSGGIDRDGEMSADAQTTRVADRGRPMHS